MAIPYPIEDFYRAIYQEFYDEDKAMKAHIEDMLNVDNGVSVERITDLRQKEANEYLKQHRKE